MDSYDVMVVGAGLAGLQSAQLLARRGASVLLIDRKVDVTEKVHTTGIFVRRSLEDFPQVLRENCLGPAIRRVEIHSPSGRRVALESAHVEFRVGRMGKLYESMLRDARRGGVEFRGGVSYAGARKEEDRSLVRLQSDDAQSEVRVRYLIGADGAQSRVARDLELSENKEWIVGVEDVYESRGPQARSSTPQLHCVLDPKLAPGYIAWVADDGQETHVGVGGYADRFEPRAALEEFRLGGAAGIVDFAPLELRERRGGRIPVGGILADIANTRGLLVGDASGAVSPLTAGGLDPCLRLSALAARVTADYLRDGDARVLREYRGNRFRRRFLVRGWLRRALAGIRSRRVANLAIALLGQPSLTWLARRVFFGPGSFPLRRYELGLPSGASAEPLKGRVS